MRYQFLSKNIIDSTITELIELYIKDNIILDPSIFNLDEFDANELSKKKYHREGDFDDFFAYENDFRSIGSSKEIGFKVYFCEGEYEGNGLDLGGIRLFTFLKNFPKKSYPLIKTIELFIDDSNRGIILINNKIMLTFWRWGNRERDAFRLMKISTVFGYSDKLNRECRLSQLRNENTQIVSKNYGYKKYKKHPSILKLIDKISEMFPDSLS